MIGDWWGPSSFSMPTSDIICSNRINLQIDLSLDLEGIKDKMPKMHFFKLIPIFERNAIWNPKKS